MKIRHCVLVHAAVLSLLSRSALGADAANAQPDNTSIAPTKLQAVVITAQKRREVLENVPVAASVVQTNRLANSNASDVSDLSKIVPSVDIPSSLSGRVAFGMRGISSSTDQAGFVSGVDVMVDGVSVPSDSQAANDLEDIKRVEVLKGPQQTLGGRGAAAGLINIVTRGPTSELTADFSASATSDRERRLNAFVGGPIAAGVEASLSAYDHQTYFPITNIATGDKSNVTNDGVRGKLFFSPTEALSVQLAADYQLSTLKGGNLAYSYITPGAYLLFGLNPPPLPPPVLSTVSQQTLLSGITLGLTNEYNNSAAKGIGTNDRYYNFVANLNYQLGSITLGSTTAYQHDRQDAVNDLFYVSTYFLNDFRDAFAQIIGPFGPGAWSSFDNTQLQDATITQFSEELKLLSGASGPLSYVVGLYFEDQKVDFFTYRNFAPAGLQTDVVPDSKTYDAYARTTWKFARNTSLITGLRYNSDRLSYQFNGIEDGPSGGLSDGTPISSANSKNSSALIGDISLQRTIGDTMVYAKYSRGYNPAQFNLGYFDGTTPPVGALPLTGQEHVNSFEIGSKGTYLNDRMRLNLAIFDTMYQNYQVQTQALIPGVLTPQLFLAAAAKAETRGAEADVQWLPARGLSVGLDLAYADAKFEDYANAPCWSSVVQTAAMGCVQNPSTGSYIQNISGKPLPDSPKFKGVLDLEQRWPLAATGYELTLDGNYAYRTSAEMLPDQNPEGMQGGFGLLDLNVGVGKLDGTYSVTAFVDNVTNHHYVSRVEDFYSGPWQSNAVLVQPARDSNLYFGLRIDARL